MRLFEAILNANHSALAGDSRAGVRAHEFGESLPIVALTCIDPRLNPLLPEVLGIREEDFIWLRNAGNILFDSRSGMIRSLALACAVKGGKEIAIVGHSDCRVRQVSVNQLIESFRALGIDRSSLPDNLVEFFGLFSSERQNVITGANHIRQSPLISPKVPVHGLLLDLDSGRLDWLVNGYETLGAPTPAPSPLLEKIGQAAEVLTALKSGEFKVPEVKIGAFTLDSQKWISQVQVLGRSEEPRDITAEIGSPQPPDPRAKPPPIPIPPPIRLAQKLKKFGK